MIDYKEILLKAIQANPNAKKWTGSDFESIKQVSNTAVGKAGQAFVRELCEKTGFSCEPPYTKSGKEAYNSPWDLKIENVTFEIKTASEDIADAYQFNHVRLHRRYDALMCVGIAPNDVFFNVWTKAAIATSDVGKLTNMEKGGANDFKLPKRRDQLHPINDFEKVLDAFLRTNFANKTSRK